jgi:hypothetical protein
VRAIEDAMDLGDHGHRIAPHALDYLAADPARARAVVAALLLIDGMLPDALHKAMDDGYCIVKREDGTARHTTGPGHWAMRSMSFIAALRSPDPADAPEGLIPAKGDDRLKGDNFGNTDA